ncbi:uncharacterized protein LOC129742727 [Uranotaenia lowii]|uniref:uncharacterized protein LOC129742727 n=1 Tax=Uranotaenia lowii TaxID=190385 RepID=UPI00247A0B52|nr:uncharacterized protein LOC129742727 [Uranotaenia lowii]
MNHRKSVPPAVPPKPFSVKFCSLRSLKSQHGQETIRGSQSVKDIAKILNDQLAPALLRASSSSSPSSCFSSPVAPPKNNELTKTTDPVVDQDEESISSDILDLENTYSNIYSEILPASSPTESSTSPTLQISGSHRPSNAVEELLLNESIYVQRLANYIDELIPIMIEPNLPHSLKNQKNIVFANIEAIYAMHRDDFLPQLEQCAGSAEKIASVFIQSIDSNRFYCYVFYALNKMRSEKICKQNEDYLLNVSIKLNKFLLEPILRLPRYKLMFSEICKRFLDSSDKETIQKTGPVLCRAEKRIEKLINLVDAAVSLSDILLSPESSSSTASGWKNSYSDFIPISLIINPTAQKHTTRKDPVNLLHQGQFQKFFDVDIYDNKQRRKYPAKVFYFDKIVLYTEIYKGNLEYRGHYYDSEIIFDEESSHKLKLYCKHMGNQEILIQSAQASAIEALKICIEDMRRNFVHLSAFELLNDKKATLIFPETDPAEEAKRESEQDPDWEEIIQPAILVQAQLQFCRVLEANNTFYLSNLSTSANVFLKMYDMHYNRILPELAAVKDPFAMCELFFSYLRNGVFVQLYYDYIKEFKKIIKTINVRRTAATFNYLVAAKVEDFAVLCIDQLEEYCRFFQQLSTRMAEDSISNKFIDMTLYRHVAMVLAELNKFEQNVRRNYQLFLLDDRAVEFGLVKYCDLVTVSNAENGNFPCKIFISERAVICISIFIVEQHDKTVEHYGQIIFIDKFNGRGCPMNMRKSKKADLRLSFIVDSSKYKVTFKNNSERDCFYQKYIDQYVLVK